MEEIVAKLEIVGIKPSGEQVDIVATIGKPFPVSGNEDIDEWACPVSLSPLYKKLHGAHGVGSFQALCLASNLVLELLQGFLEKGGRLQYSDGTSFPLDSYSFCGKTCP